MSACASKLKGRVSRWLREAMRLEQPTNLLSKGYFACTSGKSKGDQVTTYLDEQSEHHGYAERVLPPVFVKDFTPTAEQEGHIQANHAFTSLQFHLVLATWRRRGVFSPAEAEAVARRWLALQSALQFVLLKVSFVPDHVHVAVRVHPALAPGVLVAELMNSAQRVVFDSFPEEAIRAGVERLWQPSAYVGSFGDLASPQIRRPMCETRRLTTRSRNQRNHPRHKAVALKADSGLDVETSVTIHGTRPWYLRMPRPCAVEAHAGF